jgi:putative SOS response-associated peptidase YedK
LAMCGRFSQSSSAEEIAETFQVETVDLPPRYNVAPSQTVAAVLQLPDNSQRQLQWLRWGLIPAWSKDSSIGFKTINARAETVAEKPSYRSAFRQRRCLIPANGFYEWQRLEGSKSKKQPYFFSLREVDLFAFAGLYESWASPTGEIIKTFTVITTTANELVETIHDRMPVILNSQDHDLWLDPSFGGIDRLQTLLKPYPAEAMKIYPVSTLVNSTKNDSVECTRVLTALEEQ